MRYFKVKAPNAFPLNFEPRRTRARRRPASAVRRAAAIRNRGHLARTGMSEEQFGAWLIQAGVALIMLGIVAFFHVPLLAAVSRWF